MSVSSSKWCETTVVIRGASGPREVVGYLVASDPALAVTENVVTRGGSSVPTPGYVITHVRSGHMLWPNVLPLERAQAACAELLTLGGWNRELAVVVCDDRLRAEAETICSRWLR